MIAERGRVVAVTRPPIGWIHGARSAPAAAWLVVVIHAKAHGGNTSTATISVENGGKNLQLAVVLTVSNPLFQHNMTESVTNLHL